MFETDCEKCPLYIPYGSNKTKKYNISLQSKPELYIPYGSNKTKLRKNRRADANPFISHMVQIKLERWCEDDWGKTTLYPIWFK